MCSVMVLRMICRRFGYGNDHLWNGANWGARFALVGGGYACNHPSLRPSLKLGNPTGNIYKMIHLRVLQPYC